MSSERKTDYFGSFLGTFAGPTRPTPPTTPTLSSTAAEVPVLDPLNEVLKALLTGDRSIKDLLAYTGNSLSAALSVTSQLERLGYVEQVDGDAWRLTPKGRGVAAMVA